MHNAIDPDGWIQTATSGQVWPLEAIGQIRLMDIAHSLSQICRFNGHTHAFYSVAQHSVTASRLIAPEHAAWGLLHDAAEAYIGDITRPVKRNLYAHVTEGVVGDYVSINEIERNLQKLIASHFALSWPPPVEEIEEVDLQLLHSERRALLGPSPQPWGNPRPFEAVRIIPVSSQIAKEIFLARAAELGIKG